MARPVEIRSRHLDFLENRIANRPVLCEPRSTRHAMPSHQRNRNYTENGSDCVQPLFFT